MHVASGRQARGLEALLCVCAVLTGAACTPTTATGGTYVPVDAATVVDTQVAAGTDATTTPDDVQTTPKPLPAGPAVELVTNKNYLGAALQVIQTAQKTLDITEFETTAGSTYLDTIVGNLKSAAARGVKVRVLMDDEIANNAKVVADLKSAGIDAKLDGVPNKRTHVKLLLSEQGLVVGSTNWSQSSMYYNNEANVLVRDPGARTAAGSYFAALWANPSKSAGTSVKAGVDPAFYSDGNYQGVVQPLLQAAKKRILLVTYSMNTDDKNVQTVLADVKAAKARGVDVRVLLDTSTDSGADPSVNTDAGTYLKGLGATVRNDPSTTITHAKFIVIDDTVVLGSNNWGYGGFLNYHEAGIRSSLASLVTATVAYFEKLWATGTAI